MKAEAFDQMVARLEKTSAEAPWRYHLQVAGLALVGFGLLALITGLAGVLLVAALGLLAWLVLMGHGGVWLLLLKLGKLIVLALVPLWMLVSNSVQALLVRLPAPTGHPLSPADAPALFAAIDRMRQRMRGPRVHHVLLVDSVNAAIVQRPLFGLAGFPRNYLLLGLPLLEAMTPDEALAVVAHEYGHLSGAHGRFGAFIYRLRNTWGTVQAHAEGRRGAGGKLLKRLVAWYAPYFNAYTFVLARQQEYQADAAAAELVGAESARAALKRSNVAIAAHRRFMEGTYDSIRDHAQPPPDLARRWADIAVAPTEQAVQWLSAALDQRPDPLDTHPTLRQRLDGLGTTPQAQTLPPDPVQGPTAAAAWLGGALLQQLREAHQDDWQRNVSDAWHERHAEWTTRRQRVAELQALPEPTPDEQLELLRLRRLLEPDLDLREALAAYNQAHSDQALGLYLEGVARLDRDDTAGVAVLERCLGLDADAVKPVCEQLHAWFLTRDPAAAEAWAARWRERDAWEQTRQQQLDQISATDRLSAPTLDEATVARVRELLTAHHSGIRRAWLARRDIPADPQALTHVIVIELSPGARLRQQGPDKVAALARCEWPLSTHICLWQAFPRFHQALKDRALRIDL